MAIALSALVLLGGVFSPTYAEDPPDFVMSFGTAGTGNGQFDHPTSIAFDSSGNIYVTDFANHRIQKFSSSGTYLSQFGTFGSGNGQFYNPYGIALDSSGNIYVTDIWNHRVQKFSSSGIYLSQFGTFGSGNGQFYNPYGIALDSSGNIYVTDILNHRVQKFSSSGTYVSQFGEQGAGNGQFYNPSGIAFDSSGNIYVADSGNHRVQKFSSSGTYLSQFGTFGTGNGQFNLVPGITLDTSGNIYVSDYWNNRIQKFSSAGTYLSQFGTQGVGNGQFNLLYAIAIDSSGNIWVPDYDNNRIQKFAYPAPTRIIALSGNLAFGDVRVGSSTTRTLTISNVGNSTLTVSSIAYPTGFTGNWSGTIAAKSSQNVTVTFTPTAVQTYSGLITVNSDKTGGTDTIAISGKGVNVPIFVNRTLPQCYVSGSAITITLNAVPPAGTQNYSVTDAPPAGWAVSNISDGGSIDPNTKKVKFGPFFDGQSRTLTYQITPPSTETGNKSFGGNTSADGFSNDIGGQSSLGQCQNHPADMSPMDFVMTDNEVTAYGAAWRRGNTWSIAPNPIPIGYVTRAVAIWKGGETYKFDPAIPCPGCWVNTTTTRSERDSTSSAVRVMPAAYIPGQSFTVSITVKPGSDVAGYAVEDKIPSDKWEVSVSSSGDYDAVNHTVTFGPFGDKLERTLTYRITAPSDASGSYTFSGIASFNGLQDLQIAGSVTDKASPGDVNGSGGTPDLADAIVALRVIAGLNPPNVFTSADVNSDNKISLEEVIYILQKVAGLR